MLSGGDPRKGQKAIAFGAPRKLSFSVTEGIVSPVRTQEELKKIGIDFGHDVTWVQTTATIAGGSSGGPLVNQRGEVIGVNTLGIRNQDGLNFAVSVKDLPAAKSLSIDAEPFAKSSSNVSRQIEDVLRGFLPGNND